MPLQEPLSSARPLQRRTGDCSVLDAADVRVEAASHADDPADLRAALP